MNGCVSESRSAQSGVPHGSVLGPILFLIYVNDLPNLLQEKVLLFADDVKLIFQRSHSQTLQNDLMKAYEWSKDWNLPLNESKCAFLTSGSSRPTPYSHFDGGPDLPQDLFFTLPSCSHLRGHDLMLRHRSFHLARRKAAFSVRLVEPWNKLPPFVINSPSVVVFKDRLNTCWEFIVGSDEPQ